MTSNLLAPVRSRPQRTPAIAAVAAGMARRGTGPVVSNADTFEDATAATVEHAPRDTGVAEFIRRLDPPQRMWHPAAWFDGLRASMRAHRAARQLAELDDRQLLDIGIGRSEILAAVHGLARDSEAADETPVAPVLGASLKSRVVLSCLACLASAFVLGATLAAFQSAHAAPCFASCSNPTQGDQP